MQKYDNVLIDLHNLFWRSVCMCVKKSITEDDDREFYSATIEDTLERIKQFRKVYCHENSKIYFLYDNPFSKINERQAIFPDYKHARKNKNIPPLFYKSLDKLLEILKIYDDNFILIGYKGCEADDLVPTVLTQCKDKNNLLISADMDWARGIIKSLDSSTDWFNYNSLYDQEKFFTDYGFNPSNNGVKMYKAIHGDKSDSIDNAVPYLPKEILLTIVDKYSDIYDLMSGLWKDNEIPKNWKLKIKEAENQLKINYQLVDYINIDIPFSEISFFAKEDINSLRSWFSILNMTYENRMLDRKKDANIFLEKKKSRRYFK